MPHVTFIHGIANKPAPEELLNIWRYSLALGDEGLDLGSEGVTSSMVYWADVLYPEPQPEMAEHESNESVVTRDEPDVDWAWFEALEGDEQAWSQSVASKLGLEVEPREGDEESQASEEKFAALESAQFEAVPLPWWLKRRLMKMLLRDVHHYLFNAQSTPRPGGPTYQVQDEIRNRMISALEECADGYGPHVIVSHSMGTVISYDCLKRVPDCPAVDALVTIGSPLGLDDIQTKLKPEWTRDDGFPHERATHWINVFDRLDVVAALDPYIANDYLRAGESVIEDIYEPNYGRWRHNITKYLAQPNLRKALSELLGIPWP